MNNLVHIIQLPSLGDDRGSLVPIESLDSVPFEIKRVYYVFDTKKGISRGFHAHKTLKQVAVCVCGSCSMFLDNGREKAEVVLDSPTKALLIDQMVWHEMGDFSSDCILLVLADERYIEADYIRSYEEFLKVAL